MLAEDCDWAPTTSTNQQTTGYPNAPHGSRRPLTRPRQVCIAWNYYPVGSFGPACKYDHSCASCEGPHKAQQCRQKRPQQESRHPTQIPHQQIPSPGNQQRALLAIYTLYIQTQLCQPLTCHGCKKGITAQDPATPLLVLCEDILIATDIPACIYL